MKEKKPKSYENTYQFTTDLHAVAAETAPLWDKLPEKIAATTHHYSYMVHDDLVEVMPIPEIDSELQKKLKDFQEFVSTMSGAVGLDGGAVGSNAEKDVEQTVNAETGLYPYQKKLLDSLQKKHSESLKTSEQTYLMHPDMAKHYKPAMFGLAYGAGVPMDLEATVGGAWPHTQVYGRGIRARRPRALDYMQNVVSSLDKRLSPVEFCQQLTPAALIDLLEGFGSDESCRTQLEEREAAQHHANNLRARLEDSRNETAKLEKLLAETRAELDRRRVTITQVVYEGRKFHDDL